MLPIELPASDVDLLAECDVHTYRASGKGGQHVNTTDSAVRLRHRPTGVVVTCQDERSQHRNKSICLEKLRLRVAELNYRPPSRRPTRMSRSARDRLLRSKRIKGQKKLLRGKPHRED